MTAPESLIRPDGKPEFGIHEQGIGRLNYQDFVRPGTGRRVAESRIKRWEYFGLAGPEVILGAAVVTLGIAGNVFFYVYDRREKRLHERSFLAPLCRGIRFDSNGLAGTIAFARGAERVTLTDDRAAGRRLLEVELAGARVSAELLDRHRPLACVTRTGFNGFNYTLKLAGLPAAGRAEVFGKTLDLAGCLGVVDYTTGCLARETFWNWASGGGRDAAGNLVGINLVQGVNETGFTENAFWLGERPVKVDTVDFDYNYRDILAPWRIRSYDGRVDLRFTPEGERRENLNAVLMASRFHQPFGTFRGTLKEENGAAHEVEMHGYTEEHYARW